ncbi:MAG: general secretion pathway protein C [Halioglobus sp.]
MSADWLNKSSDVSARVVSALAGAVQSMSEPARARRLRQVLLLVLALWAVLALAKLVWALVPMSAEPTAAAPQVINPVVMSSKSAASGTVDIERMRGWHLFGEAGAAPVFVAEPEVVNSSARDGIENGARETRLKLVLRGIVASTENGLGHAIIEYKSVQNVYAVEDKMPLPGRVSLAKVMPKQVVLDNGGTYELLVLFEDSKLASGQPVQREPQVKAAKPKGEVDKRGNAEATALAQSYRERLYKNPQSLSSVVSVSAVREGGELLGYRVRPGKETEQFAQLGFKAGDVVTSVNGIELNNPANTMVLYNAMRSAGEVVFELKRDDQPISLSVSLDATGQ